MTGETRWKELKTFVQAQGWRWQPGKQIAYGEQILVTADPHQATVNFYPKRGKMVVGGSDSPLRAQLNAWIQGDVQDTDQPADIQPALASATPPASRLDALKQFVREQGWNWGPGADIAYGEQIVVSDAGVTALVNFWPKRGKMDVQGPDSSLKAALQAWVVEENGPSPTDAPTIITGPHIGMDESGKGDWFGPLVVAAVYVDERTAAALRRAGVRDSKTLAPSNIQRIAGQIERAVPPERRHVWAIEPETYNQLHDQHRNVNLLLVDAYAQVAEKVWGATQAQTIVCDQFSQRAELLENAFSARGLPAPVQQHKAESASVAVAAASILSSATFATALKQLDRQAAFDGPLPKGSSDLEAHKERRGRSSPGRGAKRWGVTPSCISSRCRHCWVKPRQECRPQRRAFRRDLGRR